MKSLQDLNNHSQTSLEITDNRGSRVVFDRVFPLQPLDQILTISRLDLPVDPGINIVEIISYNIANVRYRVNIVTGDSPTLTGSNIEFATLPSGLLLTQVGNTYTISGISTVEQWEAIKSFTWNIPANYTSSPLWYLEVAVVYYDSARDEEMTVDWEVYDNRFYYIGKFYSNSSVITNNGRVRNAGAAITGAFVPYVEWRRIFNTPAAITCVSTMQVSAADAILKSSASVTAAIKANYRVRLSLAASSSVACDATKYAAITNMTASRSYQRRKGNTIFQNNTPYIEDNGDAATYQITLTAVNGQFGTATTAASSYTFTGTKSQVNAQFSNIYYYPSNSATDATFSYTQKKNGVVQTTKTGVLNYNGIGSIETIYVTYYGGVNTWIPPVEARLYGLMDYLIVGGGGAGGNASGVYATPGGGGGGGAVKTAINQPITLSSYTITVGAGGTSSSNPGGASSFNSVVAAGGQTGAISNPANGGASGTPYNGGGGVNYQITNSYGTFILRAGGGGGGAGGTGYNATLYSGANPGAGGPGIANALSGTNITYGKGGSGGRYEVNPTQGSAGTRSTAPGSGGGGSGLGGSATTGLAGVVIIKIHA